MDSMKMGISRLKDISTSLRIFSRADSDRAVEFNLHEGIDSTLHILKHRLKADEIRPEIEVIRDYGDIPEISCFPGQLNQVLMNLLANAIDAIDEKSAKYSLEELKANPNQIMVQTKLTADRTHVIIHIQDNALGMPEEVKDRIFDYLYTTKEVGKGTGLGLAIAKQIIEEVHNGKIQCHSTIGVGTEFAIELPV
jgi:signal transduction histidine kinase